MTLFKFISVVTYVVKNGVRMVGWGISSFVDKNTCRIVERVGVCGSGEMKKRKLKVWATQQQQQQ
jgi:hypothetical protein